MFQTVKEAESIVTAIGDDVIFYKIGYQLVFAGGLDFARELAQSGKKSSSTLKLLDIDNTVASGVENIAKMGMSMLTLHAYPKAMRAAVAAAKGSDLTLLGVTVLTSMDDADLTEAGYQGDARRSFSNVPNRQEKPAWAASSCSAEESSAVRDILGLTWRS